MDDRPIQSGRHVQRIVFLVPTRNLIYLRAIGSTFVRAWGPLINSSNAGLGSISCFKYRLTLTNRAKGLKRHVHDRVECDSPRRLNSNLTCTILPSYSRESFVRPVCRWGRSAMRSLSCLLYEQVSMSPEVPRHLLLHALYGT